MSPSAITPDRPRAHRGLSTARAALQITALLAARPAGVRAEDIAAELGKSTSTAYNLLASLCDEAVAVRAPGGRYLLTDGFRALVASGAPATPKSDGVTTLTGLADELFARTHKRAYLGVVRGASMRVLFERGQQGIVRIPGLGREIGDAAHALALGKILLSHFGHDAFATYVRPGLRRFTPATVTDPRVLRIELEAVRRTGVARDREEFGLDFCCIAAPIVDGHRLVGAVGISTTLRAFHDEHESLEETVRHLAFQASAQTRGVLAALSEADVRSAGPSTQRSVPPASASDDGHRIQRRCRP
jgi:acetyl-CoA synthetase